MKDKIISFLKNNLSTLILIFFIIVIFLLLFLIVNKDNNKNDLKNEKLDNLETILSLNTKWDYQKAIEFGEKIIQKSENNDDFFEEKIILADSYLNYWNYFYKEEEYSKKWLEILDDLEENFKVLYLKW